MKALKIGLVDLDTSHPESFIPIIRELGHEVTAVMDSGGIHPAGYAVQFARQHQIEHVCLSAEEMAALVDAVLIHSCNWDQHVQKAKPFIDAGKAVFIDKPLAGTVKDLQIMAQWCKDGAILTGSSALRYCEEVKAWRLRAEQENEKWLFGLTGCSVDEFNYGIHAYSMLHGMLGAGIATARHLGTANGQQQIELGWKDGRRGIISVGTAEGYLPFYSTVVSERKVEHITVDNARLYRSLLETVLPYLAGDAEAPIPFAQLMEAEWAAIAAKWSLELGGSLVRLEDVPADFAAYDGKQFEQYYRQLKYPSPSSAQL